MSSTYQPSNDIPSDFTPAQRLWLENELAAIKRAWEADKPSERLTIRHAAPDRINAGDLVYADGTDWNPDGVSGAGMYRRNEANDAWVFIG